MISKQPFPYKPEEYETEKASNAYLMSLVVVIVGLPFPIINLIATWGYFMGQRKSSYFVRWHCLQALLSQISIVIINAFAIGWTWSIILSDRSLSNGYLAYMALAVFYNLLEFVVTIVTAIETRKGQHLSWWMYGPLTQVLCKPKL